MRIIGLFAVFLWIQSAAIADIVVGKRIPKLEITNLGELILSDDNVSYQHWSTDSLTSDKVHTIQYLAGRMSAKQLNSPFTDRLQQISIPKQVHHVTTIVNLDDSLFGTSRLVAKELHSKKKRFPTTSMVADKKGTGAKQWKLSKKNSAIMILSKDKQVLFFKDGALTETEIDTAIEIIRSQTSQLAKPQAPVISIHTALN